jgi:putative membrane protein
VSAFANILIGFIAVEHLSFLILEMFFWTKPLGLKSFRMTRETAQASAALAKNQGLYNGFLAAGLLWSLFNVDPVQAFSLKVFFLGCVFTAGIYGGLTASRSILRIQALPAGVALAMLWAGR